MAFGIDDAIAAGLRVLDKFVPDPAAKAKAELELRSALLAWDTQQAEINKIEAQNPNIFVSGWRPAIGWACAYAFIFIYTVAPTISWMLAFWGKTISMPQFMTSDLMSLTFALLGLGGLRTFEKMKGLTK